MNRFVLKETVQLREPKQQGEDYGHWGEDERNPTLQRYFTYLISRLALVH